MRNLKAFFIGVIGKEDSIYRRYSDVMLSLCQIATECLISSGYNINIDRHDSKREQLISKSIINNIISADMFFVLADYLFWDPDNENNISQYKKHSNEIHWGYNPNVWFEYGLAATTNKSVIMIKCNKKSLPFNSQEIHAIDVEEHDIKFLLENLEYLPCHPAFNNIYNSVKKLYESENSSVCKIVNNIQQELVSRLKDQVNPFQYMILEGAAQHLGFKNILDLLKSVSGVQFIDGEDESFKALIEDVKLAKSAIFTTRFANQSIVNNTNSIHYEFMSNLLEFSTKPNTKSERIICNNSIKKWIDIHKAISNLVCVYVRGNDYSAHFELVVIDENTTFIHFYDKSISNNKPSIESAEKDESIDKTNKIERINSTLRISANPDVCKKLLGVFQRHYRKPLDNGNQVYSQTILGVVDEVPYGTKDDSIGVFCLDNDVPEASRSNSAIILLIKKYTEISKKYNAWYTEQTHREKIKALTAKDIWRMYYGVHYVANSISYPINDLEKLKPEGECPKDVMEEYEKIRNS